MSRSTTVAKVSPGTWELAWLTPARCWLYGGTIAAMWLIVIGRGVFLFSGSHNASSTVFGEDFTSFWAASRLVLRGMAPLVYVPVVHRLAELPVIRDSYEAFFYPPPYLLLCTPLSLLPFFAALVLFLSTTLAGFTGVIAASLRRPWAILAVLAFAPVAMNVIAGQNAFLTAGLIGLGLMLLDRRPTLAGAVLGLMVIKPHLALAIPIALIASRRWRVLATAAASSLGLVGVSYLVFGRALWVNFLAHGHAARVAMEQGLMGIAKLQSAFGAARMAGLSVQAAYVAQAVVAVIAVSVLLWAMRKPISAALERSLICLASMLMTPFILHYDMVALGLPLAWMLREWLDNGFPRWGKLVLVLTFLAPMSFLNIQFPFGLPTVLLFGGYLVAGLRQRQADVLPAAPRAMPHRPAAA